MIKSMKKLFVIFIVFAILALGISLSPVFAKNDKNGDIPEQDGIYNVLGHPELKVRVFVHKAKPGPGPSPAEVCGLPDPGSDAIVGLAGWHLPANWTYNLNPSSAPSSIGSANFATIANNAFAAWTSVLGGKVNIVPGPTTTINRKGLDGKNIVTWGTASGSALGVTYIWYNPTTGAVTELDTILNTKFSWMWSNGISTCAWTNVYDAQDILTHEIGHWFGLDDEYTSDYTNNTMYGYGSKGDAKADTLTNGDVMGVQANY